MDKEKKLFVKHLTNFLVMFVTIFTLMTIIFATINEYVYKDFISSIDLLIIGGVSLIVSILLLLLLRINNISIVLQVIMVYTILALVVLLIGYFVVFVYDVTHNYKLFVATTIFLVLGLIFIIIFFVIRSKMIDRSLNNNLKHFKERDRK